MSQAPSLETQRARDASLLAMAYAGLRLSVAMTLLVVLVFTGLILQHFPGWPTYTWGAALLGVALLRYGLWAIHRRAATSSEPHPRGPWRRIFILGATVAGASWSVGPVLLVPEADPASALLLALVVLAVGAVSIGTLTAVWPALFGFVAAAFLPTVVALAQVDSEMVRLGAGVMLASMGTLIVVGRRSSAATRALVESELRSAELDQMKSAFLGMASHELRTPMTGILGYSELVLESPDLPEQLRGWAGTINEEALRLQYIVADLLNVSRIDAGLFEDELESVSLADCVSTALRAYEDRPDVPAFVIDVDERLRVVANAQRLLEVLENLVSNAVKYSPDDRPIEIVTTADARRVRLSVIDSGLGIPAAALPTLFDRFQRIDSPERSQIRGTGLGLYIVKRYVDSFGASIEVDSVEGEGSTFTVVLQRTDALAQAA